MRRVFMFAAIIVTLLVLAFQVEPSVGQDAAPPTEEIRIAQALPADGSENIPGNASITIVFNRPIAPLGTSIDQASLPQPLVFEPPINGHGEWINTSIYEFYPSSFLTPNTTYHVTINAGLTSADGAVLAADYQWGFQTATPTLHRIAFGTPERPQTWYTQNNNLAVTLRNPSIWFYFGGQVDPAAIEPAIFIRRLEQTSGSVSGTIQWQDSLHTMVSFTPDELLDMDTAYTAGIDFSRLPPHSLTLPEGGRAEVAFRTVPYPSIVSTDPADGTENAGGGFTVHFATPMDAESIAGRITVDPQPEALNEYYQYDQYYLAFPVQPRTTYTITLPPGMRDIYGNEITDGQTIHFTSAPPSPNARLNTPGLYGFFNAYNANTGVYLTYRNVESVDLDLYTLRVDQFLDLLTDTDSSVWVELGSLENRLLRSWTVHLAGPQDTEIPHYLSLGSSDECVGAPQPRLAIGADAEVIAERGMTQAMSAAGADEISAFLYPGVSFPVVGGPLCIDRRTWWELQTGQDSTSWVAESGDHGYILEPLPLAGQTIPVRGDQDSALAAGIYMLNMAYQASPNYRPAQTHFMMVMTANLIVQASPDEVLVWATDVQTGQPIANAPITVYSQGHGAVAAGVTGEDGLLQVRVPRIDNLTNQAQIAVLRTADQFGIGSTRWADGVDPGNFGLASNYAPPHYRIYAYTDRPIYRPGQTAYFRAMVRSVDDVAYFPPDLDSVPVQISQGDHVIFSREVPLTPYGTLSGSFTIPDESYGYYQLMVTIPTALDQNPESTTISFSVGEYRLPEFQVSMTPQPDQVARNEDIHVQVNSRYFFDAPVSDAWVEYRVIVQPYTFRYQGDGYYQFYDRRADADSQHFGRVLLEDEGRTDAQGMYDITFPANLLPAEYSQLYTIEATIFDQTTGTVSEQTQMIVHAGRVYIGGRPDSYVGYADEPLNINLIAVDWNSHGIVEQPIDIEVIERRYHSVQEVDSSGRATWTSDIEEIPVSQGHVITGEDGKSVFNFTPPNGGSYEVRLTTHDREGHTIHSTVYVWAAGTHYVPMQQRNNHRIDLIADQEQYQIGDTAAILITSPFQGTHEALVTVERGSIFTVERITLTSNTYVYHVPITAQYVPNVFVSVILIKGVDDTNPVADFRMGLVQLSVDPSQRNLNVEIIADRDRAEPSGNVTFTVRTTNSAGNPVTAEIGAALTDVASLSVLRPDTRQLMDYFYHQEGIGVRTGTVLSINTDYYTQYLTDMIKGGGGGGDGESTTLRTLFVDTPYWQTLTTDPATGEVMFTIPLPDNLTTWRLNVYAITRADNDGAMLVGQNAQDVISTLPLMVRPVTPRFFVVDDQVTLAAVVNNNTTVPLTVDVTPSGDGLQFSGDAVQQVTVAPDGAQRVEWNVTVQDVESVDFSVTVRDSAGQYADSARSAVIRQSDGRLPVYQYTVPETVGTSGVLSEAETRTESILLPNQIDAERSTLTVQMQPSLAAVTLDGLDYLRNYPYQCIEQTISRFLPNIMTLRALNQLGVPNLELQATLTQEVAMAVEQLTEWQMPNGGWGWFAGNGSNPLTTAYALIALSEARDNGLLLNTDLITGARNYLNSQFIIPSVRSTNWELNRQAFVLYALARSGSPDIARTSNLYSWRTRLNLDAQAFLMMTLHRIDPTDRRIEVIRANLISAAVMSATGTHWEESRFDYWNWSTDLRTTAIVLDALIQIDDTSELLPNVVRWLVTMRQHNHWETTQQTAWAVMSLTDWMAATHELQGQYDYAISVNDTPIANGQVSPDNVDQTFTLTQRVSGMLLGQLNPLTFERGEGVGSLYYTAYLNAVLPVPEVHALNAGIIVERHYVRQTDTPTDTPPDSITQTAAGDIVQVRLTVIAPTDLYYVHVEDPLPAGLEIVRLDFMNAQQLGTSLYTGPQSYYSPDQYGWNSWWFRNIEYRDEKVVLYADYLPAGTYEYRYLVRAGVAGTYNVLPPTAQEFYFPEVYGRGDGSIFTVTPAD